jgi:hypothetical protein
MKRLPGHGTLLLVLLLACDGTQSRERVISSEPSPKSSSKVTSAAPSALPSSQPRPSLEQDQAAVKQTFLDYQRAIGEKRGDQAADLAAQKTIAYFEWSRKSALTMPEAELRKQSLLDRMQVLVLRAKVDPPMLRKMDGRGLFVHAVNEGMVGKEAQSLVPGSSEINGDTAQLGLSAGGQTLPPKQGFRFERENGKWKLDVMSIAAVAEGPLRQMLKSIDPDENAAIVKITEQIAQKPLARTIWIAPDAAP